MSNQVDEGKELATVPDESPRPAQVRYLRPCGWCGRSPRSWSVPAKPTNYNSQFQIDPNRTETHVQCATANCPMNHAFKTMSPKEWNTRAPQWQPIETAPKDGQEILLAHGNSQWIDWWTNVNELGGFWCMCDQWETPEVPSHWMPLPALPDVYAPERETETQQVG